MKPLLLTVAILLAVGVWWLFRRAGLQLRKEIDVASDLRTDLESALKLPVGQRLETLLRLHEKHGDAYVLGDQIRNAIIASGRDAALPAIDEFIAKGLPCSVAHSVIQAVSHQDAEEYFRVRMFQKLLPYLDQSNDSNRAVYQREVPRALLALDHEWAGRILNSPEYLNPEHPLYLTTLGALNDAAVEWSTSHPQATHFAKDLAEARQSFERARAMWRTAPQEAESQMRLLMDSGMPIRSDAASTLAQWYGLPEPWYVGESLYMEGGDSLNHHERIVTLAFEAYHSSTFGALDMFVEEERAKKLPFSESIVALKEVGATENARWLESIAGLIAARPQTIPGEPPDDLDEEFWNQVSKLPPVDLGGDEEDPHFLIVRYMIEHAVHFRRTPEK